MFFGSLNLLAISVVGEYLIRTFEEVKRRPKFIRKALWHGGTGLSSAADIASSWNDGRARGVQRRRVQVKSVLITGTTSGLGRGLLEHYVESEVKVISVNRRRVAELEARHPSVRFECVDVRSAQDVEVLVRGLAASGELPDVFILNAGINRLDNDETFDLPLYREVIETNLYGVLNFIGPLTQLPAVKVERHVVAISSMVSLRRKPLRPRISDQQAGSDNVLRRVVAACTPGRTWSSSRSSWVRFRPRCITMDEKLPRWIVRIKAPLFRVAERHGPRRFALCADAQEEADPSLAGLRGVRRDPVRDEGSFPVSCKGAGRSKAGHDGRRRGR